MPASLFEADDRPKAEALCKLTWCNPFHEERQELERQALGSAWKSPPPGGLEWDNGTPVAAANPNTDALTLLSKRLASETRDRLRRRVPSGNERETYRDLVIFALFYQFVDEFHLVIRQARDRKAAPLRCAFFRTLPRGVGALVAC